MNAEVSATKRTEPSVFGKFAEGYWLMWKTLWTIVSLPWLPIGYFFRFVMTTVGVIVGIGLAGGWSKDLFRPRVLKAHAQNFGFVSRLTLMRVMAGLQSGEGIYWDALIAVWPEWYRPIGLWLLLLKARVGIKMSYWLNNVDETNAEMTIFDQVDKSAKIFEQIW